MSEVTADLLNRARGALAQLSVVCDAPTPVAHDQAIRQSPSKPGTRVPRLPGGSDHWRCREALRTWLRKREDDPEYDTSHIRLRTIITDAELALERHRFRSPRRLDERGLPESGKERDGRIIVEYEGMHYADAAAREGATITHIRKLRKQHGRHPTDGVSVGFTELSAVR